MGGEPTTVDAGTDEPLPPNLPRHMVQATAWPSWFEDVDEDICVLDWGLVFPKEKRLEELAQPKTLRAPETFFVGAFDWRHDLWRVGCVVSFGWLAVCDGLVRWWFADMGFGRFMGCTTRRSFAGMVAGRTCLFMSWS